MRRSWEDDLYFYEWSPWSQYAGFQPKHVRQARARGWRKLRALAAEGDEEALTRLRCRGCRRHLPVKGYEAEHTCGTKATPDSVIINAARRNRRRRLKSGADPVDTGV